MTAILSVMLDRVVKLLRLRYLFYDIFSRLEEIQGVPKKS